MKKKILMIGPCRGHNIQRYLDVFQKDKDLYDFAFANYHPKREFSSRSYPGLEIFDVWNVFKLLLRLLRNNDILWIHMHVPIPLILFALIFRNRKSVVNYNIWGESIPRVASGKGLKAGIYRFIMREADHVMCPWYATYEIIKENIGGVNAFVHPMGMNGEFFDLETKQELQSETQQFLNTLPNDVTKLYFPKSFSNASDHDLIIEAGKILLDKGVRNFIIYFWMGNQLNQELEALYRQKISELGLNDHISIIHHSFLPTYDIQQVWLKMDVGLQIAIFDLLSTTILEPMFLEKEFIATDIAPYRIIEEKYNVDLDLIPMDKNALASRMERLIKGYKTNELIMKKRKEVTETHFNTYNNIPSIVSYLITEGRKK
ncbi:MAG: glycosyltransferase [Chitinophagales bacterium]|nr:glycosyltransferase [Chitinophagales bacterium]